MVLLVVVCLIMSLFVEVFICLFPTVLTPWGAEPFPSFVCMYNGHFKNASNNDVLLVGYSTIEWLTRLMRPHRQLSLLSQPQIALHTVLQMCAVGQQGTGHKKNICLSYLVKKKISRSKHTWFLGILLPLEMTLIDSLIRFGLQFLHLYNPSNKICALYS